MIITIPDEHRKSASAMRNVIDITRAKVIQRCINAGETMEEAKRIWEKSIHENATYKVMRMYNDKTPERLILQAVFLIVILRMQEKYFDKIMTAPTFTKEITNIKENKRDIKCLMCDNINPEYIVAYVPDLEYRPTEDKAYLVTVCEYHVNQSRQPDDDGQSILQAIANYVLLHD
jgi:hypothetical protein